MNRAAYTINLILAWVFGIGAWGFVGAADQTTLNLATVGGIFVCVVLTVVCAALATSYKQENK